jgi:hypothetical protein
MKWQRIAFGVGFCPFWWQCGDVGPEYWNPQRMYALGPFRFSWRGWR